MRRIYYKIGDRVSVGDPVEDDVAIKAVKALNLKYPGEQIRTILVEEGDRLFLQGTANAGVKEY